MLKCSYIILVHNHQNTISQVIDSLKKINGSFLREFIFIDDGSSDDSVSAIKSCASFLPKTTIVTNSNIGSSLSINQAINLISGNYAHFVNGQEIITPNATARLIDSCEKMGSEVAFGISSDREAKLTSGVKEVVLVDSPISAILKDKFVGIRNIGLPGSLVSVRLLDKTKGADRDIYTHNMSLSLKCAKYSKFVFVKETVSLKVSPNSRTPASDFEVYNNLRAIYNFAKDSPEIANNYRRELIMVLCRELNKVPSNPFSSFTNYVSMLSLFLKSSSLTQILKSYKQELDKLF